MAGFEANTSDIIDMPMLMVDIDNIDIIVVNSRYASNIVSHRYHIAYRKICLNSRNSKASKHIIIYITKYRPI